MPLRKQSFTLKYDDLTEAIDVDDSAGRSVPINMNFVEEGFLVKDTGSIITHTPTDDLAHSIFLYKKKSGLRYLIRALATKLQYYSFIDRAWYDIVSSPTFTAGAEFGYVVYDDVLYFGNAVESLYSFDGVTFTAFGSAPKGNILDVFEDRLCIAGVLAEPLSIYYSNVGVPTTFSPADVLKPLGTDSVTFLINYFGVLLIFKENSIWKVTFVYDQVVSLFVPKLDVQNAKYGACSRHAVTWVENDIWFFNGTEVRSIGYADQQLGVLGINKSVISDPIKQTLSTVLVTNQSRVVVFYENRRFYLSVMLGSATDPITFVCHLLHRNSWTKYVGRDKARLGSAVVVDGIIYSTLSTAPYGAIKWKVEADDSEVLNYYLTTE